MGNVNKLFKKISLGLACVLGMSAIGIAASPLLGNSNAIKETEAADTVIYSHTFKNGDFRTDMWWGVDGNTFWGNNLKSIDSTGGTFLASEYLWRFGFVNESKKKYDKIYIPIHFTGDVKVRVEDTEKDECILEQYYKSGDSAIVITGLNTTCKEMLVHVNRRYSSSSTTTLKYGETVVISAVNDVDVSLNKNGGTGGADKVVASPGKVLPNISSSP